jgi:hypothetical protein
MAERDRRKQAGEVAAAVQPVRPTAVRDGDEAERFLGRVVAAGLPIASVLGAIIVGFVASVGSGLLVLASGALLGTIALLWASVRTLSGDAPLPADLEALAGQSHDVDALAEQKRRVLRALKDLASEHAIGKIDDADYEAIANQYRDEAKTLMREMDRKGAPSLVEAERVAGEYLASHGLGRVENGAGANAGAGAGAGSNAGAGAGANAGAGSNAGERGRLACPGCATSNEPDAAFCKKCGSAMRAEPQEKKVDATS